MGLGCNSCGGVFAYCRARPGFKPEDHIDTCNPSTKEAEVGGLEKLMVILGYIVRSRSAWAMKDPVSREGGGRWGLGEISHTQPPKEVSSVIGLGREAEPRSRHTVLSFAHMSPWARRSCHWT